MISFAYAFAVFFTFFGTQPSGCFRLSQWAMLSEAGKKEQKLIRNNVFTRHNAIVFSRDEQSWRSSFSLIQTYLQFPV